MTKVQMITGFRLSEINTSLEFIIRKLTLEHENYMLQELKMAKQGMAVFYQMHMTKIPYLP